MFTIIVSTPNDNDAKLIETNDEMFTSDLVDNLNADPDKSLIDTIIIHEDEDIIWQMCFLDEKTIKDKKVNDIVSALTLDRQTIYGNAIIFGSKVIEDGSCINTSMTIDDLKRLQTLRQVHVGCTITMNGNIEEFKYDPALKDIKLEELSICPVRLFGESGFYLHMLYNRESKEKNKIASMIAMEKIVGNVYIISKISEHVFTDIDKNTLNRLIKICKFPKTCRQIEDSKEERNEKKLLIVKNKWFWLKKKESLLKNKFSKCYVCDNDSCKICSGCYRLHYCSSKCQTLDWPNHKNDCNRFV